MQAKISQNYVIYRPIQAFSLPIPSGSGPGSVLLVAPLAPQVRVCCPISDWSPWVPTISFVEVVEPSEDARWELTVDIPQGAVLQTSKGLYFLPNPLNWYTKTSRLGQYSYMLSKPIVGASSVGAAAHPLVRLESAASVKIARARQMVLTQRKVCEFSNTPANCHTNPPERRATQLLQLELHPLPGIIDCPTVPYAHETS